MLLPFVDDQKEKKMIGMVKCWIAHGSFISDGYLVGLVPILMIFSLVWMISKLDKQIVEKL
jgi:hypothetical protein